MPAAEGWLKRAFTPVTATRYFEWPTPDAGTSYRLWLNADELVTVTTLTAGGVTIPSTDYFLEPNTTGPPYNRIEIDLASSSAFGGGSTRQRSIGITGVWCGCPLDTTPAGSLAEALDATEVGVDVTDSSAVGVGSVLVCESERMLVTGKTMLTTGSTATLGALNTDQTLTPSLGVTGFVVGETLLLDSERVSVTDVTATTLIVKRAWDGTTLAAHTAATVYAPRTLTVARGALGTNTATHATSTALTVHVIPGPVRSLAVAEAIVQLQREGAGYASTSRGRTVGSSGDGSGSSGAQSTTTPLDDFRGAAMTSHGRQIRVRAV